MRIPIDFFIFDFDGTLADSIPPAIIAIQDMLLELGYPPKTTEQIHAYVGYGEKPLILGALGTDNPQALAQATESYGRHYIGQRIKEVQLYPHVREFLEYIKDKPKAIISNKGSDFLKAIIKDQGLESYFIEILGGDNLPALKPDPTVVNNLLKKYKVEASRTLFIGDMTIDIETGKNAGTQTCGVTYGFDPREKLLKFKPDFLVDDILELKNLILFS